MIGGVRTRLRGGHDADVHRALLPDAVARQQLLSGWGGFYGFVVCRVWPGWGGFYGFMVFK